MFGVSREAATVRLLKLGYFTGDERDLPLFR
jgi:hypothetical protein